MKKQNKALSDSLREWFDSGNTQYLGNGVVDYLPRNLLYQTSSIELLQYLSSITKEQFLTLSDLSGWMNWVAEKAVEDLQVLAKEILEERAEDELARLQAEQKKRVLQRSLQQRAGLIKQAKLTSKQKQLLIQAGITGL